MRILLHTCCAPCALMCIEALQAEGAQLSAYWYNINIHPYQEYKSRRDALAAYAASIELPLILEDSYGLREFVGAVADDIDARCGFCYRTRLEKAAQKAKEGGFDGFTTSLLISPYQKHEMIARAGREAGEKYGLPFVYRDFRPLFREGQARARALELYMQKYCGCVFSEEERYLKRK